MKKLNNITFILPFYNTLFVLLTMMFLISLSLNPVLTIMVLLLFTILYIILNAVFLENINSKISIFINVYIIYLVYYFFIESIFIDIESFALKQKLIVIVKLIIFYIGTLFIIVRIKFTKKYLLYYSYVLYLGIVFFINSLTFMEKSIYLLNSFFPIAILLFLLDYTNIKNIRKSIFDIFFYAYIFSLLISILIMFDFISWDMFFFNYLYRDSTFELVEGMPRTWFTTFLDYDIFRRFNGTLADPIIFGYLTCLMLFISLYSHDRKIFLFPLILFFLLSSLSKGSIYLFLVVLVLNFIKPKIIYKNLFIWLLFVLGIVLFNALLSMGKGSSSDVHYLGLVLPFLNIIDYNVVEFLFGHGFTSGGNLAKGIGIVDNYTWLASGAESGIGTIFYQTGFFGLIFVVMIFYKQLKISSLNSKNFISIYFILMFTQENLINLNYLIILFIGIMLFNIKKDSNWKKIKS